MQASHSHIEAFEQRTFVRLHVASELTRVGQDLIVTEFLITSSPVTDLSGTEAELGIFRILLADKSFQACIYPISLFQSTILGIGNDTLDIVVRNS